MLSWSLLLRRQSHSPSDLRFTPQSCPVFATTRLLLPFCRQIGSVWRSDPYIRCQFWGQQSSCPDFEQSLQTCPLLEGFRGVRGFGSDLAVRVNSEPLIALWRQRKLRGFSCLTVLWRVLHPSLAFELDHFWDLNFRDPLIWTQC